MIIAEYLQQLCRLHDADQKMSPQTCDTVKCGDVSRRVTKVAVAMFATTQVIRDASAWGAQLLVAHEPIFYGSGENATADHPIAMAKNAVLQASNLVIFRYHDHPHCMDEDLINQGTIRDCGLEGRVTGKPYKAITLFRLNAPMTARDIASTFQDRLNTRHVRIVGALDVPGRNIAFACGAPGPVLESFLKPEIDVLVTGEIAEWDVGEMARDQAQLGKGTTLLVLGHCVSERYGMRYLVDLLTEQALGPEVRYFECGELYSYTDS